MSEIQTNRIKSNKMVSRKVAIALGIICIVLVALIAYFTVTGISATTSYNNLQNQNKQLQTWLIGNETLLNQTETNDTLLQNQNTNLTSQVNDLTSALYLEESTVWVDNQSLSQLPNSSTEMDFFDDYAGYVSVNVTSTTFTTYVEAIYSAHGIDYDNRVIVGINGTAIFPVLPPFSITPFQANFTTSSISFSDKHSNLPLTAVPIYDLEILVGNANTVGNATETVTITYYY